jgi:ubiquinone/menaquinone biosynthesis C-methylase UbiE
MQQNRKEVIDLKFSHKYHKKRAQAYNIKHQDGLARKLSNWREIQVARKAIDLAGQPGIVLDLPCGTGRFWQMLKEKRNRVVIAADNSEAMLDVAREAHPWYKEQNISCMLTSVFAIDLPDSSVDSIFCMRLLHHIGMASDRNAMLKELYRVTRDTVIVSLWVDGNFKAMRRTENKKDSKLRGRQDSTNRFIIPRALIEAEFSAVGFDIVTHLDFLPLYHMWRTYILRKN